MALRRLHGVRGRRLFLGLGVVHRQAHAVTSREAGVWNAAWVVLAPVFDLGLHL